MVYLRGRVKFPIGGNEIHSLSPRACKGRIWCDSKADSIVWMGEDGGSADVRKMQVSNGYLAYPSQVSLKFRKLEGFICYGYVIAESFFFM